MNAIEVGNLLAAMAMYDYRDTDPAVTAAWLKVIGDLPYADAEAAVLAHYATSRERIMPADIRERVKAIRSERLRLTQLPAAPPHVADDPDAYRLWVGTWRKRIADGDTNYPEIEAS